MNYLVTKDIMRTKNGATWIPFTDSDCNKDGAHALHLLSLEPEDGILASDFSWHTIFHIACNAFPVQASIIT